ncbi:ATP-binding protein [Streptosporangium lutulentum]|uniref:Anti-sigma regulatory factor (Ser/Thr protein kinase) n=1 Tax=Streptosporangium lutulentum TaxID=1461250 RepID=A0ABT9Q7V5_9ACTN|nr:ATP-binding protein [Streptosporangium lutulentum]MDP9842403.1 anti-sigma regulatory factor (Ser/Thr protein kinase) [Streptosporangium lutulentum]
MNPDQGMHWPISTDLTALRHRITQAATLAGLTGTRRDDLLLAANEAVINVLEHGGGVGTVTFWHDEEGVSVEISDTVGLLTPRDVDRRRPSAHADGGFGLWLMGQLCDEFTIHQQEGRSIVRLRMRLHPAFVPQPGAAVPQPGAAMPE